MHFLMPNYQSWFVNTGFRSLNDMDITKQIVAIDPQPSAGCKRKPRFNCKDCSYIIRVHIIMHNCGMQHSTKQFFVSDVCAEKDVKLQLTNKTVLTIVPIILQTIIIAQMLYTG